MNSEIDFCYAIDPGTFQSACVQWSGAAPHMADIMDNGKLLVFLRCVDRHIVDGAVLVIEGLRSYGNVMGQSTIDTAVWSGRFQEAWEGKGGQVAYIPRVEVKKHVCHNGLAKDANITQALIDRFAYGKPNRGKGTKKEPGFFYGFKADIWQSFALAVTAWDLKIWEKK